jgi:hypothetical protein
MAADFYVSRGKTKIWVSDADDQTVAVFETSKKGGWAYHCFCMGVRNKEMSLFDTDKDQYVIGTINQLTGKAE